jgi:hypothetical protein
MCFTDDDQPRRCKHKFDISNLELIHHVPDQRKLDFLETYYIRKNNADSLMNKDRGPSESPFFEI